MKGLTTDEVFDAIGHLGRGQLLYMAAISVLSFFVAFHMVLNIFTGLVPHFSCIPFSPTESALHEGEPPFLEPVAPSFKTSNITSSPRATVSRSSESSPATRLAQSIPSVSFYSGSFAASARHKRNEEPSQLNQDSRRFPVPADIQRAFKRNFPILNNEHHFRALRSGPEEHGGASGNPASAVVTRMKGLVTEATIRDQCPNNDPANCRIIYDPGFRSIVQEWGLVCHAKQRVAEVQAAWMTGVMMGALLLARLPDMYGRTSTLLVATLGTVAFEGLASFTEHFVVYVVLRLLGGTMCAIVILASFVLSQEIVGASKRSTVGAVCSTTFSIGIALLAAMATTTDNWRTLTLMVSVAGVPCAGLILFLPESPRWLASKGRLEEAAKVLQRIAHLNGTTQALPKQWHLLPPGAESGGRSKGEPLQLSDEDGEPRSGGGWLGRHKKQAKSKKVKKVLQKLEETSAGLREMVRHGYIARLLVILLYSWFVNSAVYYGLTLAASDLGSNVYLSTALNGLVELPSNLVVLLVIDRLGRRFTLVSFMVCGGVACLLVPLLRPLNPAYTGLALLGKLCISASFTVSYIHSGEIFPTCMRNTGIGLLSVSARTGGIVCPFILMLGDVAPGLHFAVLGLLALTSGLLNILLPETLGRPTPETVDDVLAFKAVRAVSNGRSHYSRLGNDEEAFGGSSGDEDEVVELDMMTRAGGAEDKKPLVK